MKRGTFLKIIGLTGAFFPYIGMSKSIANKKFFTLEKINGRHFLITPDNKPFFSIGLNHIDSASLRYAENLTIWTDKYGNSMEKWLSEAVRKNLIAWGFNSVGWVQEVVTREPDNHRHSRNFTPEEYRWLDMPYFHMLPFADFHQWENETVNPDFFSKGFEEWCDYVARDEAARLADDPNLIGYFYIDCPTWVHVRKENEWKKPLFDPEKLSSEKGKKELFELAKKYYQVTQDSIRRYDKNHLIFGDRYEANKLIAPEVIKAAVPYIDALSFQHFAPVAKIAENLNHWHGETGLPTLLADCSHTFKNKETGCEIHNTEMYGEMMEILKYINSCVGYHLCGAYIKNHCRKKGLLDENEGQDEELIKQIRRVNHDMQKFVNAF